MTLFRRIAASLALAGLASAQAEITLDQISPKNGPFPVIPLLGFGTWELPNSRVGSEAVANAIVTGFRHFDCAQAYSNQKAVATGLKDGLQRAGLKRQDIWVTTKIWSTRHGSKIPSGLDQNLQELGLDYIDLVLMHFPIGSATGKAEYDYVAVRMLPPVRDHQTWKEMEKLVAGGKVRHIGISNFNIQQLSELLGNATIKPFTHQNELHPYLQQKSFVEFHKKNNVTLTAYAPLGNTNSAYRQRASRTGAPGKMLADPVLGEIGKARGCSPAQVALKWNMRRGVVVHPKAANKDHQKENFEAYKCPLTAEDDAKIAAIDKKYRFWNPCKMLLQLECFMGLDGYP
ncbi:Aldo/keto reductase [Trichodelitschia bisporula]|uniref:Aldo/keto reductase n=1 Tax=Trichodelitschia bisporula TaxID=703511 RepID=A0A6G1I3H2_9PEZI|nr:Aldo/keto reductase [Trichodelitschia bisporula]